MNTIKELIVQLLLKIIKPQFHSIFVKMAPTRKTISTEQKNSLYHCHIMSDDYYLRADQSQLLHISLFKGLWRIICCCLTPRWGKIPQSHAINQRHFNFLTVIPLSAFYNRLFPANVIIQ